MHMAHRRRLAALSAVSFSLPNTFLFFMSAVDFLPHYNNSAPSLFESDQTVFKVLVGLASASLCLANAVSFKKHIEHWMIDNGWLDDDGSMLAGPSRTMQHCLGVNTLVSGTYKGITASLSLVAFCYRSPSMQLSKTWSWAIGVVACVGNVVAQVAILRSKSDAHKDLDYYSAWTASHCLTLLYNLSNTALYFNTLTNFPKKMGWQDHRVTEQDQPALYDMITALCVTLFVCTQLAYSRMITSVLTKKDNLNYLLSDYLAYKHENCNDRFYRCMYPMMRWLAWMTSPIKSVTNCGALAATLTTMSEDGRPIWLVIAGILLIPNIIANIAALRPEPPAETIRLGAPRR